MTHSHVWDALGRCRVEKCHAFQCLWSRQVSLGYPRQRVLFCRNAVMRQGRCAEHQHRASERVETVAFV